MFAALYAPSVPTAALLEVARGFTPRFEQCGSMVLLDATGLSRLFGSPQELGQHLRDAIGGDPRVALASTQVSAALLALGKPGLTVVAPGREADALAPIGLSVITTFESFQSSIEPVERVERVEPVERAGGWSHPRHTHQASRRRVFSKRAASDKQAEGQRLQEILAKWGIKTLGALAALPRPEVRERLGARGSEWQQLARGDDARPMVPWVDEIPFEAVLELEWPIDGLEPLSFVLARLLEPLSLRLEQADRGAAVLCTSLRLTNKTVFTRTLQLPAPMRDPKTLRTLMLLDLESHPPEAAIDTVRVHIEPTPGRVLQWTLLERAQPSPEQVSTLLARLTAVMGEGRVGSPMLVDTWRPGAFDLKPFEVTSSIVQSSKPEKLSAALRRFRLPVPARVVVQEGRPIRVSVDRTGFSSGAIVEAAGPWRTSGEWWKADAWDRDEWDAAMPDGTVYRLAVERSVGQWFVEGILD
jgi:protein ImuB